jgi:hypothetical protein
MRIKVLASVAVLLVLGLVLTIPASAQEQTGSIQGAVKDAQGGVLPGVTVEAKNLATGATQTAVTGATGIYRFPSLPPGRYDVSASLQGFQTAKTPNVILTLGQLLTVDLSMAVAGVSETVQVTGESPLIDTKQNATFSVVPTELIDRIPKGRDFTGVLAAAPGANAEARAGGISVDGASGAENRFVIDGVDTTNLQNGSSGKTVVTDFIQEVQVKTSGYNAEYPGATGGVVNALTKSGTNQFRGSFNYYYTNNGPTGLANKDSSSFWKGKQRPNLRLVPTNTKLAEYYTVPLDDLPTYEPVFELGGPIMRDKLWFWAGYAPVRAKTSRTVTWQTPVAGGPATQTFTQDNPIDRLTVSGTWQMSNNMRLKGTYAPTWSKSRGSLPGIEANGTSTSNAATDYASVGSNNWNNAYSGLFDWVVKPSFFVNVSGGYFMTNGETLGSGTEIRHTMNGNISTFPGVPADLNQPDGYTDTKANSRTTIDKRTRKYVNATGTWYKSAMGQHAIKGGVRFEQIGHDRDVGQVEPTITFYWDQSYPFTTGGQARGTYGYYAVSKNVLAVGNIHSNNWGLFLQDAWSIGSRLTVNYGVRVESERIPFYTPGQENDGIKFGFGDKFAPRVGFAYDLKGDGKWKAFGSYGRFFDIMKLELPSGSLGGEQWHIYNYSLDTYNWKGINCQEADPTCPGKLYETQQLRFGSNEANNPDTQATMTKYFGKVRNLLQDNMKPMTSNEFTLGMDHELTAVTSVGARYVRKWVSHVIEDFGWNEDGTEFYFIGNPGEGYIGRLDFLWGQPVPSGIDGVTGYKPAPLYNPANTGGKIYPQVLPKRDYNAIEFNFKKRLSNRWSAIAVYQYSRLTGNYPGLASSDEAGGGTARLSPNVNRLYDGPWMMYDTHGNQVLGRLNTDRPHYFKAQGTYDFPWGTSVGVNWYIRSGAEFSKYISYQNYAWVFYEGRGSMGRTPTEQQTDLYVQQEFKLGKRMRASVSLNVANLTDNNVSISLYDSQFRDTFTLKPLESFFSPGFDPLVQAVVQNRRPDPRFYGGVTPAVGQYGNTSPMNRIFLGRRDVRIGLRLTF